ncbi:MAG: hypothetical protein JO170_08155 [Verrucomicrobia bacterium]|nr:hypothetical protein [Verrucomicrobiota bacterium]
MNDAEREMEVVNRLIGAGHLTMLAEAKSVNKGATSAASAGVIVPVLIFSVPSKWHVLQ